MRHNDLRRQAGINSYLWGVFDTIHMLFVIDRMGGLGNLDKPNGVVPVHKPEPSRRGGGLGLALLGKTVSRKK